jgi:maleylacetate reductase
MTSIWGLTDEGQKQTGRDERVAPRTVLYVPKFTTSLPPEVSGPSGMNAMAHCVEALWAVDRNPVGSLLAEEGIRALAEHLPQVVEAPGDLDARAGALYGAHLAGRALDGASMALHHKLCLVLGGTFGLPHGPTHAVLLPYAVSYNAPGAPGAATRIARALGADDAAQGLYDLNRALDIPPSLEAIGLEEEHIDQAADEAVQNRYSNPREVTREGVRAVFKDAFEGRRPRSHAASAHSASEPAATASNG